LCFSALTLLTALAIPVSLAADDDDGDHHHKHHHYQLIDMGTFGGPNSSSPSLNARGVTAGWSATSIPKVPTSNPLVCGGVDGFGSVVTVAFRWQNGILTNLGALPGAPSNCSEPFSVNDHGGIVGTSENGQVDPLTGGNETRAVMWKDGEIKDLGSLGGNQNLAFWINNRGQVVGWSLNAVPDPFSMIDSLFFATANGTQTRAFLWEHGHIKDLGTLGGNDAAAGFINERGEVAGTSYTSTVPNPVTGLPPADPFLWEPPTQQFPDGRMIDLGGFGGANGFSNALNNRGQVIGGSSIATNPGACFFLNFFPDCHPFLWDQGKLIDLSTTSIGGSPLSADWFNDAGEIVGFATFPNAPSDAYLWRTGVATDLGHLKGDCFSRAWGINSLGQVVGDSLACDGSFHHAFLWENRDLVDLNTLIPPGSPLELVGTGPLSQVEVPNINHRGEIVGIGVPPGCPPGIAGLCGHAFLLIPCDEHHPDVEGCDYSMAEAPAATQVSPAALIPASRMPVRMLNRFRFPWGQRNPVSQTGPAPEQKQEPPANTVDDDWTAEDVLDLPDSDRRGLRETDSNGKANGACPKRACHGQAILCSACGFCGLGRVQVSCLEIKTRKRCSECF
jgi:probable HAF family extracellular repeat protein